MMITCFHNPDEENGYLSNWYISVAKACQDHAQRVQNSVFEANLDYSSFLKLKDKLIKLIDEETDSLRFYYLGNNWKKRIEHVGAKETYDSEGVLIV